MNEESSTEQRIHFFKRLDTLEAQESQAHPGAASPVIASAEPGINDINSGESTCSDAETFALRVLDDSMEPEFRQGCLIIIDPTGHARDGAYVLAINSEFPIADQAIADQTSADDAVQQYTFRQLQRIDDRWCLVALNKAFAETQDIELTQIVGVIIQRAGVRRRYHKHYE